MCYAVCNAVHGALSDAVCDALVSSYAVCDAVSEGRTGRPLCRSLSSPMPELD